MRSLDPEQTPQELQPAKVPTVLIFGVGTLAWLILLLIWGVRYLVGHSVDGQVPAVAAAGMLLGVGGMLWGRSRKIKQGASSQEPSAGTSAGTEGEDPGRAGTGEDRKQAASGEDRVERAADDGDGSAPEAGPAKRPFPDGVTNARGNTEESS